MMKKTAILMDMVFCFFAYNAYAASDAFYNNIQDIFENNDAVLLGITVDNIPTLFSWTNQMGKLWFEVLSDFWPHGGVAAKFGVLRSDGVAERALFVIDKKGIIRHIDVHNINQRPSLEDLVRELERLK